MFQLLSREGTSCLDRLSKHLGDGWNKFDLGVILTWLAAYVLRFVPGLHGGGFVWVRIAFSLNFNMFFFRIFSRFSASRHLGPVVTMLRGMVG